MKRTCKRAIPALVILLIAGMLNGCGFIGVIVEAIAGVAGGAAGGTVAEGIGGAAGSQLGGVVGTAVSGAVKEKGTEVLSSKFSNSGSDEEAPDVSGDK